MSKQILNLAQIWNDVAYKEDKPLRPRDYSYASELSSPLYDRFLKMKAVPFTNPPNKRSLKKFLAGNIWEFVVKQVLLCSGVFKREEVKVDRNVYSDCMDVHGRVDFFVGGLIDVGEAMAALEELHAPEYLYIVAKKIIESLDGKEYELSTFELKSCSSFAMDKVERTNEALYNNASQAYYYKKGLEKNTQLAYICKDDSRMAQFDIGDNYEDALRDDLLQITHYYTKDKTPPLEPLIKFTPKLAKFEKNFGVEYSPYLSHYGFENPDEYRESIKHVESWNRVIERFFRAEMGYKTKTGQSIKITDKNKSVKAHIESSGYKFNEILEAKIKVGADDDSDDE